MTRSNTSAYGEATMRCTIRFGMVMLLWATAGTVTAGPTYSGSLTGDGGGITGIAGNPWLTSATTFSWSVEDNSDGTYTYTYRLQVPTDSKEISHVIMEVSPSFTSDDVLAVLQGTLDGSQPDDYPKASDVGMPSPFRGVKFEDGAGGTDYDWTMSFTSGRVPVWGDFYAVDGKKPGQETAIWNEGFGDPDSDPLAPLANGSLDYHILVPDTTTVTIPAPGALTLAGIAVCLLTFVRRRHL